VRSVAFLPAQHAVTVDACKAARIARRDYHWSMAVLQIKDPVEKNGRKTYRLPSIVVLDVSRLGSAGQVPAGSWTGKFQEVLDACELGNLGGALVVRSVLASGVLEPLCWRGDSSLR
jgi:hypothetical protein